MCFQGTDLTVLVVSQIKEQKNHHRTGRPVKIQRVKEVI